MKTHAVPAVLALLLCGGLSGGEPKPTPEQFRLTLAAKVAELDKNEHVTATGHDGFWFLRAELSHYSKGPFWGAHAAGTALSKDHQDPLDCILDFHAQLKKSGVKLIFVPVPGKIAVYPDKLDPKLATGERLDAPHQAFYALLEKEGIEVVDLLPEYLKLREKGVKTHCRQDSHWTPEAVKLAACRVAASIKKQPWYADWPKKGAKLSSEVVKFSGDMVQMVEALAEKKLNLPPEEVTVERVTLGGRKVDSDAGSPVVLIGDSHAIVYNEPINMGIPAGEAGLLDHLAAELGFAPYSVVNRGSGVNAPRTTLAYRKEKLANRKCVVWCITARELTESGQGWMKIPIEEQAGQAKKR
jgi:alginate O-acetyltransferase complex protein AlgJ